MTYIKIEFSTDNQAFEDDYRFEVEKVLMQAYEKIVKRDAKYIDADLVDTNGNSVGSVVVGKNDWDD